MKDSDIIEVVKDFTKGILGGKSSESKCYMVCLPLQSYLSFLEVECKLTEGEVYDNHHFWITLKDGRIIDPTADQFNLPIIWLGDKPKFYMVYE